MWMNNKKSILVVDDNEFCRKCFVEAISIKSDYEVVTARNGEEAWNIFKINHCDLLVTDMEMPGLTGIELLKMVKTIDAATRVIIVTGTTDKDSFRESMILGAFEYLTKPVGIKELRTVVDRAFSQTALYG
jgi:two-component system response regulator (stage 0 sporulation protein F)